MSTHTACTPRAAVVAAQTATNDNDDNNNNGEHHYDSHTCVSPHEPLCASIGNTATAHNNNNSNERDDGDDDDMLAIAAMAAAHVHDTTTTTAAAANDATTTTRPMRATPHRRAHSVSAFAPSTAATTTTTTSDDGVLAVTLRSDSSHHHNNAARTRDGHAALSSEANDARHLDTSSSNKQSHGCGCVDDMSSTTQATTTTTVATTAAAVRAPTMASCDTYSTHSGSKYVTHDCEQQQQQQQLQRCGVRDTHSAAPRHTASSQTTAAAAAVTTSPSLRSPLAPPPPPQQQQQQRQQQKQSPSHRAHRHRANATTAPTAHRRVEACYAHVVAIVNPGSGNRSAAAFILRTLLHELGASRVLLLSKEVFANAAALRALIRDKAVCYAPRADDDDVDANNNNNNNNNNSRHAAATAARRLPRRGTVFVAGGDGTVSFVMTQIDLVRQELEECDALTHTTNNNDNNDNDNEKTKSATAAAAASSAATSTYVYDSEEDDAHGTTTTTTSCTQTATTATATATAATVATAAATLTTISTTALAGTTTSSLSSTTHFSAAAAAATAQRANDDDSATRPRRLFLMPAVAPLPLGTGNDFSNCVGLGSGFARRCLCRHTRTRQRDYADNDADTTIAADADDSATTSSSSSLLASLCCVGSCGCASWLACDEETSLVRLLHTAIAAPCVPFDRWAVDFVPLRVAQQYARRRRRRGDDDNDDDNDDRGDDKDGEATTTNLHTIDANRATSVLATACDDDNNNNKSDDHRCGRATPAPRHERLRRHTTPPHAQRPHRKRHSGRQRDDSEARADKDGGDDDDSGCHDISTDMCATAPSSSSQQQQALPPSPSCASHAAAATTAAARARCARGRMANAVYDVDWQAIRAHHQCISRAAINYFSIGYDAYITCQFDDMRRRHPNVCASRLRNKAVYAMLGLHAARRCRPLRPLVPMVCVPSPYPRPLQPPPPPSPSASSPTTLRRVRVQQQQQPLPLAARVCDRSRARDMVALQLPSHSKVLLLTNIDCYASGNHPWQPQHGTPYYKPVDLVDDAIVPSSSHTTATTTMTTNDHARNSSNNNSRAPATAAVAAAVAAAPLPPPPPMTGVVLNDRKFELQAMGGVWHYAAMNTRLGSAARLAQTDEMFVFVLCTPADLHCRPTTLSRYTRQHLQPYAARLPHDAALRASLNVQIDGEAMPRIAEPMIVHVRPYTTHRVRVRCLNTAVVQLRDNYGSTHHGDAPLRARVCGMKVPWLIVVGAGTPVFLVLVKCKRIDARERHEVQMRIKYYTEFRKRGAAFTRCLRDAMHAQLLATATPLRGREVSSISEREWIATAHAAARRTRPVSPRHWLGVR